MIQLQFLNLASLALAVGRSGHDLKAKIDTWHHLGGVKGQNAFSLTLNEQAIISETNKRPQRIASGQNLPAAGSNSLRMLRLK